MRHNWSVTQRLGQKKNVLRKAHALAQDTHTAHRFSNDRKPAESHFSLFIKRHPQLCLRNAESTSIITAAAFSRTGIPQHAAVNTAQDEGTGTHSTSTSSGHHKARSPKENTTTSRWQAAA